MSLRCRMEAARPSVCVPAGDSPPGGAVPRLGWGLDFGGWLRQREGKRKGGRGKTPTQGRPPPPPLRFRWAAPPRPSKGLQRLLAGWRLSGMGRFGAVGESQHGRDSVVLPPRQPGPNARTRPRLAPAVPLPRLGRRSSPPAGGPTDAPRREGKVENIRYTPHGDCRLQPSIGMAED